MESEVQELQRKLAERDHKITYLENLAESLRRHVDEDRKTVDQHIWSDRAHRLPAQALQRDLAMYEARAARPEFGTPYDYSSESDDMFSGRAAVQAAEWSKKARRRAAMKKGNWVSRTVSQSSHKRVPEGTKEKVCQKPLEERFEPWVAQPGPYDRDQQGESSSSRANLWHSNVQGASSRPTQQQALSAGQNQLAARIEQTGSTTNKGGVPTGPAALRTAPTGPPGQVPAPSDGHTLPT